MQIWVALFFASITFIGQATAQQNVRKPWMDGAFLIEMASWTVSFVWTSGNVFSSTDWWFLAQVHLAWVQKYKSNATLTGIDLSSTAPNQMIQFPKHKRVFFAECSGLRIALQSFGGCGGAWFCQRKLLHPLHFDKRANNVMNLTGTFYEQQQKGEPDSKQSKKKKKSIL